MGFFDNLFNKKEEEIYSPKDFWQWFKSNEDYLFNTVKQKKNLEKKFINPVSAKLQQLNSGFLLVTGMLNNQTAELIITADGQLKVMALIEDLIACAPQLSRWRFTALKPAIDYDDFGIEMNGYKFSFNNLYFTYTNTPKYPDLINISICYDNFEEKDRDFITNAIYIFLDNYLGELDFATNIDTIQIVNKAEIITELIPIKKLKSFLLWKQKEFVEKYKSYRYNTANDNYSSMEGTLQNGHPLIAIVNTTLINWEDKASHPWIACLTITYKGDRNGLPKKKDYDLCEQIEEEVMTFLKDADGYLNVARQTAENERDIYFACKDFRLPSKILSKIKEKYNSQLSIEFEIYKDKYWQTLERFNPK